MSRAVVPRTYSVRPSLPVPPGLDVTVVLVSRLAVSRVGEPTLVTFALGSCVAVCLRDVELGTVGLLHFMLPDPAVDPERAQSRPETFAPTGVDALVAAMVAAGSAPRALRARLVGGASMPGAAPGAELDVGSRNVVAARSALVARRIPLDAEDVLGVIWRTVRLVPGSGELRVYTPRAGARCL